MSIAIELSGKVALITGASQGIGAQMARTFHRAGADIVINHPGIGITGADAEALAAELNAARPASAFVFAADVAQAEAVRRMMQEVKQLLGGVDFLINNAAIIRDRTIAKMSAEDWQSVVMLSLEDFKALEETAYLLRNPTNAKRLLAATSQLAAGKGVARKLGK